LNRYQTSSAKTSTQKLPGAHLNFARQFTLQRPRVKSYTTLGLRISQMFEIALLGMALLTNAHAESSSAKLVKTNQTELTQDFIRTADCIDFINERSDNVTCGFVDLPENHDTPTGRTITLPLLIARSTRSGTSTKAIFIPGGGGPGGPIGFGYLYNRGEFLEPFQNLRAAGFDIVVTDQRGAGFATPRINCPETNTAFIKLLETNNSFTEDVQLYRNASDACIDRHNDQDYELSNFDSYQSAKDFIQILDNLPYQWWGTNATSFATVLVQEIERQQPATFDRIVLDSPVPVDYQEPFTIETSEQVVNSILEACSNNIRCNKKYKNLHKKFIAVLNKASTKPFKLKLRVLDYETSKMRKRVLQIDDLALLEILVSGAYLNDLLIEIPYAIDQLSRGRTRGLKSLAEQYWYLGTDDEFADALGYTTHCRERLSLENTWLKENPNTLASYSQRSSYMLDQDRQACKAWAFGSSPIIKPATESKIQSQTLIIAGQLDPVISAKDVTTTAENFVNVTPVTITGMSHSLWYQSKCIRDYTMRFFISGKTMPLPSTGCIEDLQAYK